jgi:hypothetical protein
MCSTTAYRPFINNAFIKYGTLLCVSFSVFRLKGFEVKINTTKLRKKIESKRNIGKIAKREIS